MVCRHFSESTLIIASHNRDKVYELYDLLVPFVSHLGMASDFGLSAPDEVGDSFLANAAIKAQVTTMNTDFPALGDDSGLVVSSLDGQPGIYSARWAGPEGDFDKAMQRVQELLGDTQDRSASFVCALCLAWPDGHIESVEAQVDGILVWPPQGPNGFGYDPMFQPLGYSVTFGVMTPQEKQVISHRTLAMQKLITRCFDPI